jgi:hypothetical protein
MTGNCNTMVWEQTAHIQGKRIQLLRAAHWIPVTVMAPLRGMMAKPGEPLEFAVKYVITTVPMYPILPANGLQQ